MDIVRTALLLLLTYNPAVTSFFLNFDATEPTIILGAWSFFLVGGDRIEGYARSRSARQWPQSKVNILVLFAISLIKATET